MARQSYTFERVLLFATWSTTGGRADYRGLRLTLPGGCHGDSGSVSMVVTAWGRVVENDGTELEIELTW